eukprot:CAMPEP_0202017920 /NCGR_PEP_ID=MMETSP0905-20130828/38266_1 /ASSEMBLY_ACC=CAM_ASM_000554 /TAXON_ID=420261 /ORGANISM="Thalassiosira antarctica, Strain CCMP982" /LENGTH=76 /DNA_ID=CAMNT_0048578721 /DNA_START=72 /DNA_END=299 /DNA_ORIENTATION=+
MSAPSLILAPASQKPSHAMNNAHEQADGASANADTDGRCSAVLSGFNFNAVDVKMTTCSSSSSEGNMHSAQHPIHG